MTIEKERIKDVQHLKKISPFLEKSVIKLASLWIEKEDTSALLNNFQINHKYFKLKFAIPIIKHFIDVVKGIKTPGNCPVMQTFISFLIDKNISARDIFILCMDLRRTFIHHLNKQQNIKKDVEAYLEEISYIFDTNLSGVLQTFSDLSREKDKKLQKQQIINKQKQHIQMILNFQDNMICVVKKNRIIIANKNFLQMAGIKTLKELYSHYTDGWEFITYVDHYQSLFQEKCYEEWLNKLVLLKQEIIKVKIKHALTNKKRIFILKVTKLPNEEHEYIISLNDVSLYEQQIRQLKEEAYTDPVTKVYNRLKFNYVLEQTINKVKMENKQLALIVVEVDDFKFLIDEYGKNFTNPVLIETAKSLHLLIDKNLLLARIDNARFALLGINSLNQHFNEFVNHLKEEIDKIDFSFHKNITSSFAIIHIKEDDSQESVMKRVNLLTNEIQDTGGNCIKNDDEIYEKQKILKQNEQDIFIKLSHFQTNKTTFKVTAFYKEIPISWDVRVYSVENSIVKLKIIGSKVTLFHPQTVYFIFDDLNKAVEASVIDVDPKTKIIQVEKFKFKKSSILDRREIRVKPQKEFNILISSEEEHISGKINDVSLKSLSFKTDKIEHIKKGSAIQSRFILEANKEKYDLEINGYILGIEKIKNRYLVIIAFFLDHANEEKINKYIAWRQLHIIQELKSIAYYL